MVFWVGLRGTYVCDWAWMGGLFGVFLMWFGGCVLGVGFLVGFGFVCFVVLLVVVLLEVVAVWLSVVCLDLLLLVGWVCLCFVWVGGWLGGGLVLLIWSLFCCEVVLFWGFSGVVTCLVMGDAVWLCCGWG